MAKNKNRKRAGRPELSHRLEDVAGSPTVRAGTKQVKSAMTEAGTELRTETSGGSGHGTRTKQRRFGHN